MDGVIEPPKLRDELERKTVKELERLLWYREIGRISEAQFATAAETVWNLVAGLIGSDIGELIAAAQREADEGDPSFNIRQIFTKDGSMILSTRRVGTAKIKLLRANVIKEVEEDHDKETKAVESACRREHLWAEKAKARGFEEL